MVEASSGWWGILLLSLLDPLMGMGIVLWLSTEVIGNASWWGRTKNHQQLKTPKPNKTMVKPPVNLQHCLSRPRAKKKVPKEGESMAPEEQTGGQSYGRQRHRQRVQTQKSWQTAKLSHFPLFSIPSNVSLLCKFIIIGFYARPLLLTPEISHFVNYFIVNGYHKLICLWFTDIFCSV